jgi:hypothetical protein
MLPAAIMRNQLAGNYASKVVVSIDVFYGSRVRNARSLEDAKLLEINFVCHRSEVGLAFCYLSVGMRSRTVDYFFRLHATDNIREHRWPWGLGAVSLALAAAA